MNNSDAEKHTLLCWSLIGCLLTFVVEYPTMDVCCRCSLPPSPSPSLYAATLNAHRLLLMMVNNLDQPANWTTLHTGIKSSKLMEICLFLEKAHTVCSHFTSEDNSVLWNLPHGTKNQMWAVMLGDNVHDHIQFCDLYCNTLSSLTKLKINFWRKTSVDNFVVLCLIVKALRFLDSSFPFRML